MDFLVGPACVVDLQKMNVGDYQIYGPEHRILDQRVTVGCFPWRFMGGEAAFCRFVAFI